jgi:5'-phosphate synthase pdxT subunit
MICVGLVMLQGARHVHISSLNKASEECKIPINIVELRTSLELLNQDIDALIIPGGESTTMRLTGNSPSSLLLPNLLDWLRNNSNIPVLGTCAGAILLADPQDGKESLINASIDRNAYGRQINSFQAEVVTKLFDRTFPGIFIRAPRFHSDVSPENIIATCGGEIVGVRRDNKIALTFHPELSGDVAFHRWLIEQAKTVMGGENVNQS